MQVIDHRYLDTVTVLDEHPAFTGDMPTLTFKFKGDRWKMRLYTGRLIVNEQEFDSFIHSESKTILVNEAEFNMKDFRELLTDVMRLKNPGLGR